MYSASFTYFLQGQEPQVLWSTVVNSEETLAGMVAISVGILREVNRLTEGYYQLVTEHDVSRFRSHKEVVEERVQVVSFQHGKYGLWLASNKRFYYDLYTFRRAEFLQGMISFASACNVDFRNYLFGVPYDVQGNLYTLAGYSILASTFAVDVLDSNDMDEEEIDNENLIEGFHKDY